LLNQLEHECIYKGREWSFPAVFYYTLLPFLLNWLFKIFHQSHGTIFALFTIITCMTLAYSSHHFICKQENRVVDGNVERMQREGADQLVVDGKVDWKGRKALKHKHGGMKVSLLILGKLVHGHLTKE